MWIQHGHETVSLSWLIESPCSGCTTGGQSIPAKAGIWKSRTTRCNFARELTVEGASGRETAGTFQAAESIGASGPCGRDARAPRNDSTPSCPAVRIPGRDSASVKWPGGETAVNNHSRSYVRRHSGARLPLRRELMTPFSMRVRRPRIDAIEAHRSLRPRRRPPGRSRAGTSARHPSPSRATVRTSRRGRRRGAGREFHRGHPFLAKRERDCCAEPFFADLRAHDPTESRHFNPLPSSPLPPPAPWLPLAAVATPTPKSRAWTP